mmetsp:Transcript_19403/g.29179  ORF Transcript_19403/g.29179 Transcript_19403/m.29179 type:complete len:132 (-) Transcript_19403:80-475(-)
MTPGMIINISSDNTPPPQECDEILTSEKLQNSSQESSLERLLKRSRGYLDLPSEQDQSFSINDEKSFKELKIPSSHSLCQEEGEGLLNLGELAATLMPPKVVSPENESSYDITKYCRRYNLCTQSVESQTS